MNLKIFSFVCRPLFLLLLLCGFLIPGSAAANAVTDPSEVRALNAIFRHWDVQAGTLWNISGEPCSGSAINGTQFEDQANNPAIVCNCSYNNNNTCHITQLRVQKLDKRGVIPKELTILTYLSVLKIDKNYFTGSLPTFIGDLSALIVLTVSHNAFYGAIPKELGNLKELRLLAISSNNFSGTLPPELGNLVNLVLLYMDSCGAGGEIPSTFANLENLQIIWFSDSPFTGKIPDFIGNWTNLTDLRIQGNFFEGPIPSSFSKLTSLKTLRISDLYNASSSLDFIKDLKNLNDLVLRNALISGNIPPYIGEYKSLQKLDLSFNELTGQIPTSLFTLSSLDYLFLGNNSLSGALPPYKSEQLRTIDLSYNELSGSFPPWITENLQLNLVANNFVFASANESLFPGLACLQRNFPCYRNAPHSASFSIKCGGPEFRSANGVVYEGENSIFSPASYYVAYTNNWAVSNVGLFADMSYASYVQKAQTQVVGTNTPELFNTSRISPGSLRYYGFGLENGPYTVSLFFAETAFKDQSTRTWDSVGRRVFDIYIQGSLQQKDFNIAEEAGRVDKAIQKNFSATVSENYLEIHLLWTGKGTCCIPDEGYYGPSISALSVVSDVRAAYNETPSKKRSTGLIVGVAVAVGIVSILLILTILYMRMKRSNVKNEIELLDVGHKPNTFSYAELRAATDDFSPANKLGEGGFGSVFKGMLPNGRVIAVKQLSLASHHGKSQFMTEIATISVVQHRNLVELYGCCIKGDKQLIVFEYLENGSLAQALFGKIDSYLDWPTRFNICLGTARALAYLHEESRPRIIHRDVKASNILLDAELCPKISDFGLAKLYDDKKTHISTRVAGTIGYLAPEYAMRGHLTEKADVFGFGVVALEILAGRTNFDNNLDIERKYLLEWAWNLYENNRSLELVDPKLMVFDEREAARMMRVALLCIQASPLLRPRMSRVVAMLAGDIEVTAVTSKPGYLTDFDCRDITSSFSNWDTATSTVSTDSQYDSMQDATYNPTTRVDLTPTLNDAEPLYEIVREGR
ncbi:probable LRR receptor-like serine/threonine-protein kinase At1g56130 isoform X2 [Malania oleifera]|uniref:probable LRR receptor-like serine/threonine-protein kinase At1g56130 isoform X2 n=1 Tax=Malania oleifera TaxID=397392 RepID=UPI0025AE8758|nr:probable LRR receptor-like serine/threonine-protein kinase At1g56130 isoform X2 [Malania oleifera]